MVRAQPCSQHEQSAGKRGRRRGVNGKPPVCAAQPGNQVRQRRTKCECANKDADKQATVFQPPAGGDLHADRIDACHQCPGRKAHGDGCVAARLQQRQTRIYERGCTGADEKDPPGIEPVGNAKHGRCQRTRHKPDLHATGQQCLARGRDGGLGQHAGHDGR
jgi:hypothetical protein